MPSGDDGKCHPNSTHKSQFREDSALSTGDHAACCTSGTPQRKGPRAAAEEIADQRRTQTLRFGTKIETSHHRTVHAPVCTVSIRLSACKPVHPTVHLSITLVITYLSSGDHASTFSHHLSMTTEEQQGRDEHRTEDSGRFWKEKTSRGGLGIGSDGEFEGAERGRVRLVRRSLITTHI